MNHAESIMWIFTRAAHHRRRAPFAKGNSGKLMMGGGLDPSESSIRLPNPPISQVLEGRVLLTMRMVLFALRLLSACSVVNWLWSSAMECHGKEKLLFFLIMKNIMIRKNLAKRSPGWGRPFREMCEKNGPNLWPASCLEIGTVYEFLMLIIPA